MLFRSASLQPTTLGEVFQCLAVLFAEMIARMVAGLLEVRAGLPRWHPARIVIAVEVAALRALGRRVGAFLEGEVARIEAEDAEAARVRAAVVRPRLVWVRADHDSWSIGSRAASAWFPRPLYPPKWGGRTGFAASLTALEAA